MLGQFWDWLLSLLYLLILFFLSSSPKILSFSCRPPNLFQKHDDLELIRCWIVVKFEHHVCNQIPSIFTVGNFDIMFELRDDPGFVNRWIFMKFWYVVRDSVSYTFTVGICEIIFMERERKESHQDSTSGGFNPFSVSLTFGNSIGAEEKTRGISENR